MRLFKTPTRKKTFSFSLLFSSAFLFSGIAYAQNLPIIIPPDVKVTSPGGVDMRTGRYIDEARDLSIGPADDGGIDYARVDNNNRPFKTNWHFTITSQTRRYKDEVGNLQAGPRTYSVESRGVSKSFIDYGAAGVGQVLPEVSLPSDGPTRFEPVSGGYKMTQWDGTTTLFASTDDVAHATEIKRPDGVQYTLIYDTGGVDSGANDSNKRLRRVASNAGYELILEYVQASNNDNISKACVYSLAVITPPSAPICPTGSQSSTYTYNGNALLTATNAAGDTLTKSYDGGEKFFNAGSSVPYLTNIFGNGSTYGMDIKYNVVTKQIFGDGKTIDYTYENLDPGFDDIPVLGQYFGRGTQWVENGLQTTSLLWELSYDPNIFGSGNGGSIPLYISPTPQIVTDPLNRTTQASYYGGSVQSYSQLKSLTSPGGQSEFLTYDQGNIVERRLIASAGSGSAPLISTYTYNTAQGVNRNKPVTATDPRGGVTDYSYDAVHGGLLTETGPAVSGVRPQKRFEYVQRFANYKNTAGTIIQAPVAIWLISKSRSCKTSAASGASCTGGAADEVVTEYDYGPATGATNLLLRGTIVTATNSSGVIETQRTCFTYDGWGRKVSETKPLGTGSTCP